MLYRLEFTKTNLKDLFSSLIFHFFNSSKLVNCKWRIGFIAIFDVKFLKLLKGPLCF